MMTLASCMATALRRVLGPAVACALLVSPAWSQTRSAAFEAQAANLSNSKSGVRIAAIEALVQLEDDEEVLIAVPMIAERLVDEEPDVRIAAARELARLGELAADAVPDLGRALADGSYHIEALEGGGVRYRAVALAAAAALADLGPTSLPALNDLLIALRSPDSRLRAAAARAVGFMGDSVAKAAPALVAALSDPMPETRFEAAYALGQIGKPSTKTVAALQKTLGDSGHFLEALPSGATVFGHVRIAAAEALLNFSKSHLATIKQQGGGIRDSDAEEPDLPWLAGQRLRFEADDTDIRDVMAVVLRASQMTVSFRRDVEGFVTFSFVGMPAQGAFNMLLHDYNLSYEWDPVRRHVTIVPYQSAYFRTAPAKLAAVTARAKSPPPSVKKPRPKAKPPKAKPSKAAPSASPKPVKKVAAAKPKAAPHKVISMKKAKAAKPVAKAKPPAATTKTAATTVAKAATKPAAKTPQRQAASSPKPARQTKAAEPVKPKRTVRTQPRKAAPKPTPPKVAAVAPDQKQPDAAPTDISGEHKLSFIIKYDGLYRAMIDGQEYTAGMTIITAHGALQIEEIKKRAVHLLRKSSSGDEPFIIKHRRRR